jgi:hypothetical protein
VEQEVRMRRVLTAMTSVVVAMAAIGEAPPTGVE